MAALSCTGKEWQVSGRFDPRIDEWSSPFATGV
jgi:hypothetical protein